MKELNETRRVTKRGVIVNGELYAHPDLAPYVGERVIVRFDAANVQRYNDTGKPEYYCIDVYTEDNKPICIAQRVLLNRASTRRFIKNHKESS